MDFKYVRMSTKEEAERYYLETGHWIVANVSQTVGWPDEKVIVYFRETPILFIPEEGNKYPAVAVKLNNSFSEDQARKTINHFLSSLAWSKGGSIKIEFWTGGGRPYVSGKSRNCRMLSKPFRIVYLPDTTDPKVRLALAFYREALSLEHPAYSFLSYYKIININFRNGGSQKNWIERNLSKISYPEAEERLKVLRKELSFDAKVAEYLYRSCRCAVAHANVGDEVVNPESYEDMSRLREDLPLIKELSEIFIGEEFGVLRPNSILKTHPYELFGFKSIIGEEIIEKIKNGHSIKEKVVFPDKISLRLWGKQKFDLFEDMRVVYIKVRSGKIIVQAVSSNNLALVDFALDFSRERICFDPQTSIRSVEDDHSSLWAETMLEIIKFLKNYWLNGILEIWESNNKCLGFCRPFVPVNIDLSRTVENFNKQIEILEKEIEIRKDRDKS